MTQLEKKQWLQEFWNSGAFLRISEDQVLLWKGSWESLEKPENFSEDPVFSVAYIPFFSSQIFAMKASQGPVLWSLSDTVAALKELVQLSPNIGDKKPLMNRMSFKLPDQTSFEKSLQLIQGKIQRSEIEKAVPMVLSKNPERPGQMDLLAWMLALLRSPLHLNAYGFWSEESGIMGGTPELLFHKTDGVLRSMALAGTCPRSEVEKRAPLLRDTKELHEHQFVVHDLETQLARWGRVKKSATRVLELPKLLHLVTDLEVESRLKSSFEMMKVLHPTPALGVSPRGYGFAWMRDLPYQVDRELFGSPILFQISANESKCLVAIRSIQWGADGTNVGAGCGIVETSEPDREWSEILEKLNSVFQMLGL